MTKKAARRYKTHGLNIAYRTEKGLQSLIKNNKSKTGEKSGVYS